MAESERPQPCSDPRSRQFDFWLGEWGVSWGDDERGSNRVEAVLDGCVILENFDGRPSTPLRGMSISTFDPQAGLWRQTWVDNQGGYLDFEGGMEGAKMILEREAVQEGARLRQRMVWYDIQEDTLEWNWERSSDGGTTWEVLWNIHYRRKNG